MDERLFYIENNITGVWESERYSLVINQLNENNRGTLSLTNKELDDNAGYPFIYFVVKSEFDYILRLVDSNSSPMLSTDYKITIDGDKMTLSVSGFDWNFKKVY